MKNFLLIAGIGLGAFQAQLLQAWWPFSEKASSKTKKTEERDCKVADAVRKIKEIKQKQENSLMDFLNEIDNEAKNNSVIDPVGNNDFLSHLSNENHFSGIGQSIAKERNAIEENLVNNFKVDRENVEAAKKMAEEFSLNAMVYTIKNSPHALDHLLARQTPRARLLYVDAIKDEIVNYLEKKADFVQSPEASDLEKDAYAKLVGELFGFLEEMKHVPDNGYYDYYTGRSKDNKHGRYRKALEKYGEISKKLGYHVHEPDQIIGFDANGDLLLSDQNWQLKTPKDILKFVKYTERPSVFDKLSAMLNNEELKKATEYYEQQSKQGMKVFNQFE